MIVHDAPQGSPEWLRARLGIPTSSCFSKLVTGTGKVSEGEGPKTYTDRLVAEYVLGEPLDSLDGMPVIERGHELEGRAAGWYEFEYAPGVTLTEVGLCLTDDRCAGASCDRLADDAGVVEIKCPLAHTFVKYTRDPAALRKEYEAQCQGQLWVTGRAWCDLIAWNPVMGGEVVRILPDPKWHAAIEKAIGLAWVRIKEGRERFRHVFEARAGNPFA